MVGPDTPQLPVPYQVLFLMLFPVIFLVLFLCPADVVKFLTSPNTWAGICRTMWDYDSFLEKGL